MMDNHERISLYSVLIFNFFLLFICRLPSDVVSADPGDAPPLAPALYVFGDSLFDNGNNNLLPTVAKANFFPYGVNFASGPTGRFTNGRTVADFIAEYLGLPYPPPYLGLRYSPFVSDLGMNYASGSCGILHETGKFIGKCLSIGEQIALFETTIMSQLRTYHTSSSDSWSSYMAQSIFIISIGSNDYINNYLQPIPGLRRNYSPQSFASLLVNHLALHLQRLYELGARKVVMFEIGPIGCIPSMMRAAGRRGGCVEETNRLALMFNNRLDDMLKTLGSNLPGSNFILGRVHEFAYNALKYPTKYGIEDASNPCCTTLGNGTTGCIPAVSPCGNPDTHYFWDGYHLTEAVYKLVGDRCLYDSSICFPKSVKQLVVAG